MQQALRQKRNAGKELKEGPVARAEGHWWGGSKICKVPEEMVKIWDFILGTTVFQKFQQRRGQIIPPFLKALPGFFLWKMDKSR